MNPGDHIWWLTSRASGIVALGLITLSVGVGLAMAGKTMRRPGLGKVLMALHEHASLAALISIAVHGITLMGDQFLRPSPLDIAIPFAGDYRPVYTSLGIIGGYLAALLGLSFYFRKRIGPKLWRKAHRATILVYAMSVVHTLGVGTDVAWLRWFVLVTAVPIVCLLVIRMLPREAPGKAKPAPKQAGTASAPPGRPHPASSM